jgi:predicted AAA+ superfamily ATPase
LTLYIAEAQAGAFHAAFSVLRPGRAPHRRRAHALARHVRFPSNGWASNCGSACSISVAGVSYLRTKSGAEIDFIVDLGKRLLPIEVKWTDTPNLTDARHLLAFLDEQHTHAPHGYIVCRCPRPLRLHERITALPWWWV